MSLIIAGGFLIYTTTEGKQFIPISNISSIGETGGGILITIITHKYYKPEKGGWIYNETTLRHPMKADEFQKLLVENGNEMINELKKTRHEMHSIKKELMDLKLAIEFAPGNKKCIDAKTDYEEHVTEQKQT